MTLKVLKYKNPKGARNTKLFFSNMQLAKDYTNQLEKEFLYKKAKQLEYPNLSQRKKKILTHSKPKNYILTKHGNKFLLWERIK